MSAQKLAFEHSPSPAVPLRFFLTAPLFGLLAAAAIAWSGADAFGSRWSPWLLAATHLVTLGFLTMVMAGALLQVLPVVAGTAVPAPRLIAAAIHIPLACGALALAAGFGSGAYRLLLLGLPLLATALGVLLAAAAYALRHAPRENTTIATMRLALAALAVTVGLGIALALGLARGWALPFVALTDLHLQWGLIGWLGLLVAAMAVQVVPMFQSTPGYPQATMRRLGRLAFLALAAATAASATAAAATVAAVAHAGLAVMVAGFAAYTLYLQSRRRRRQPDATLVLWRSGMVSLLAADAMWAASAIQPALAQAPGYDLVLGILAVVGFGVSVVNGMLYKIAPLLAWLAMHNAARGHAVPPTVQRILPDARTQIQARLHLLALILLLGAAIWPRVLVYPAAAAYALSSVLLWRNLAHTVRVYRRFVS